MIDFEKNFAEFKSHVDTAEHVIMASVVDKDDRELEYIYLYGGTNIYNLKNTPSVTPDFVVGIAAGMAKAYNTEFELVELELAEEPAP
jgi:hypothetical protein